MLLTNKQGFENFKKKILADITEVPEILKPSYLPGLDGLRAIAIVFVLLSHIFMNTLWTRYFEGRMGVDIFFVISGFLITTLLLKEKVSNGKVSFKNFYIRRFLRIFPAAYLYLFILIFINEIFNLKINIKVFIASACYVMNFPFEGARTWQAIHFWSLSVEEQFYLLFPWVLIWRPNKFIFIILLITVFLPFLVNFGFNTRGVFYTNRFLHTILFLIIYLFQNGTISILLGSLLSILLFKKIINVNFLKPYYYLSFILFLISLYFQSIHFSTNLSFVIHDIFAILIAAVIFFNLNGDNFFLKFLENPIIRRIGILSYSIYIWQQLFTYFQPWKGLFKYADSIILNMLVLFIVAYCSYYFYEKPFLKLKDKFGASLIRTREN